MTLLSQSNGRVQGILLGLAIVVLSAFTTSDAKENARDRSTKTTLTAAGPAPQGTLVILGPDVVSCGQSVTLTIEGCYCNVCILWYHNGTYTATNNGSFTFTADGSISAVTAIDHYDCSPAGQVVSYGTKTFSYSSSCP